MPPLAWRKMSEKQFVRWVASRPMRAAVGLRRALALGAVVGMVALAAATTGAVPGKGPAVRPQAAGLAGQFLVATTELRDPRFVRTVVYMVRHDASGAMGLIVNRPMGEVPLGPFLERLGMDSKGISGDIRVHFGGPVEPARGFVLHTTDYSSESTQVISEGIAITLQPDILRAIGSGAGPRRSLLAMGYSGWAPGQLEGEIKRGSWVIVPADEALVFDENYEKKWERAMARRTIQL